MTSSSVPRKFTSLALVTCCAIGVSSALAQNYTLTDLGILPDQKDAISTPAAINSPARDEQALQVQITGTSGKSAFRYTIDKKKPMEDVGTNPNSTSRGFGLNASGQVVGDSTFGKGEVSRAALFSNGLATDLGTLPGGTFSRANGINAIGQVVGFSSDTLDGNNSRAFITSTFTSASGMTDLGTLGGAYAQALAINDSGYVTGNAQNTGLASPSHAFIWHSTTGMLDLGTIDGAYSYGTSINAQSHVAGYSTINNHDERVHAFLYNGETMLDLGSLSGASQNLDVSYALGINSADQVVGYSYLPSGEKPGFQIPLGPRSVAFLYSEGLMVDLNDLIGNASKSYHLDSATAINDRGQIVAVAFNSAADSYHAVLLTPIVSAGLP
jgi:probable HAF family extracellular repeat protein